MVMRPYYKPGNYTMGNSVGYLMRMAINRVLPKMETLFADQDINFSQWTTLVALHDCQTVWLDVPFEVCWQRISANTGAVRPLAPDYQTAHSRYESRRPFYALAEQAVSVSADDPVEKIVEQIVEQS